MGSRDRDRVPAIVPVRIWGISRHDKPFAEHVCTVNISGAGARLRGVRAPLADGEFIGLQYRGRQARFQIMWVTNDKPWGCDVGVRCIQPEKDIWQTDLPKPAPDTFAPSVSHSRRYVAHARERRAHTRYPVSGNVHVSNLRASGGFAAKLGDVSSTGCYVRTNKPLETGRTVTLLIKVGNLEIRAAGVVRVCYEGVAMGVEFTELKPVDRRALNRLITQLRAAEVPPPLLDAKAESRASA